MIMDDTKNNPLMSCDIIYQHSLIKSIKNPQQVPGFIPLSTQEVPCMHQCLFQALGNSSFSSNHQYITKR